MVVRKRKPAAGWEDLELFAIGHSTHPAEVLVELLQAHGVKTLADIRTVPKSRTNPQFGKEALARTLREAKIRYVHLAQLGGLRRPDKTSEKNAAWRNQSFRGYADYMQTAEFEAGLEKLRALALKGGPVAIMCAESLRWRCHRSLVCDALFARGVIARHISSRKTAQPHKPTPFVRIRGLKVTYPNRGQATL